MPIEGEWVDSWRGAMREACGVLMPPPRLSVSEWSDEFRVLSQEASAVPGRWRTDRTPYLRGVMDAFTEPGVTDVVLMSSAQVGKTEVVLNFWGRVMHLDPGPGLALYPTLDMAECFSKDRLAPMIRDTPVLTERVADTRGKSEQTSTLRHKAFLGGHLTMIGANSASSLAMRPIRYLTADEVDRAPLSAGDEGDPINLAVKRTTTFRLMRRVGLFSTPTIKGRSRIEAAYEGGDQRRFHVPCPFCGLSQTLKWAQVEWSEGPAGGNPALAHYKCEYCQKFIPYTKQHWMISHGEWVSDRPCAGTASFHLNQLYSPWVTWGETAQALLEAKRLGPEAMKVWVNTALGEVWVEDGERVDADSLQARREMYQGLPEGVRVLTAGLDVQADRVEMQVLGWGRDWECWVVDYQVFWGDPGRSEVWEVVYAALTKKYGDYSIRAACVDSGYAACGQEVYRFAKRHRHFVYAVKGVAGFGKPISPHVGDTHLDVRHGGGTVKIFNVAVDEGKLWVLRGLGVKEFGPRCVHFGRDLDEEYFAQLTAEELRTRYQHGHAVFYWEKMRARNEALDTFVYAYAGAWMVSGGEINALVEASEAPVRRVSGGGGVGGVGGVGGGEGGSSWIPRSSKGWMR